MSYSEGDATLETQQQEVPMGAALKLDTVSDPDTERDEEEDVEAFARLMLRKLRRNHHKGGWKTSPYSALRERLRMECEELDEAAREFVHLQRIFKDRGTRELERHMLRAGQMLAEEAADVANFAMMIATIATDIASE